MEVENIASNQTFMNMAIAVVGAAAVLCFYYFWTRRGRRLLKKDITPEHEEDLKTGETIIDQFVSVDARVYDNYTRTAYNTVISGSEVREIRKSFGNLGRKCLRDGKWVYAFVKSESGNYTPVDKHFRETMDYPPSKVHRALQQQEIDIVYSVEPGKGFFQKWGHVLLLVGGIAFAIFLFIMNQVDK